MAFDSNDGCLASHPAPLPGGSDIDWIQDPVPIGGAGAGGDCDQDPSPEEAPCWQEQPCKFTGRLRFKNTSGVEMRYLIRVNGVESGYTILPINRVVDIDFGAGYLLDCGYVETSGDDPPVAKPSKYEILFWSSGGGQWHLSGARYEFSCSLCDQFDVIY